MRQGNTSSFAVSCQRAVLAALLSAGPLGAQGPGPSLDLPVSTAPPAGFFNAAAKTEGTLSPVLRRLSQVRFEGSLSLNWRNVGPRKPGFETQIQHEVYLADMYFGASGPVFDGLPFKLEMHIPTGSQGRVLLNQLYFEYDRQDDWKVQFGKFLVPFGRYNELYTPNEFLAVTRPLLYASPDSLDLVVRPNSPRPPFSYGYADIGLRTSYYPPSEHPLLPVEVTAFVVNGLGESTNRQRTFPDPENLGIESLPANGVNLDFGHRNNNLADNNNFKSVGGRLVFALGDVRVRWPFPEGIDLKGVSLGLSAMGGQYDLEGQLNYRMFGFDASFDYKGISLSGEYMYSENHIRPAVVASSAALTSPLKHIREFEIHQGYFIQASIPILRHPRWGKRLTAVLVFNQMFRRGPQLDFFLNYKDNDTFTVFPSLTASPGEPTKINRRITKYTAALNYRLTDHFQLKMDYSYWVMGRSTIRSATSLGLVDIYQFATSMAMGF